MRDLLNENNPAWKGGKVGYKALHQWVRRHKGKPDKCVECGQTENEMWWANISGEYKRDLEDFQAMCLPCHRRYDFTDEWRGNISKAVTGEKNPFYGRKHTKESKRKMSEYRKNNPRPRNSLGQFI